MIFKNEADATHRRVFFLFVDNNGAPLAGQTFLTASGELFTSLDGAAFVAAAGNAVEASRGLYYYEASQAEVNGSKGINVCAHKATYTDCFGFDDIVTPLATSDQVSSIAVTSAAQNQTAVSRTITSGTGSGGVANTTALDAVFDTVADSAGSLDFYYQFDVSATADAVGVSAQWEGYLVGILNTLKVYAWNWGGSSWDQIGTITGIAGVVVGLQEWDLTSAHTSAGLARIRFANTSLTTASLKTDRILLGYVVPAAGTTAVTAIKTKTDLLPAVAAGALGGLPTTALRSGTAQAGGANSITLDAGASATDGFYTRALVTITGGTGAGQSRWIAHYVGSTKVASTNRNWATNPDVTSTFEVTADTNNLLAEGLAQSSGGGTNTIALKSTDSSVTDFYKGVWIHITSGTGAGQARLCTAYNGTTKVATLDLPWATQPDATSVYQVLTGASVGGVSGTVSGNVTVGGYASGQNPAGTLKPNCVIDNYTYNTQKKPTFWRERVFGSSAAAATAYAAVNTTTGVGNADNADGEVEREKYTAEYDTTGQKMLALKRVKEL